jgi:2-amino-4-hydroxy-6-hydroxymethyldihydropteridine diphosphokinase
MLAPREPVEAYIGLGANLGDPCAALRQALQRLSELPHTVLTAQSGLFGSSPVDSGGPDYVNAVACIRTRLSAMELLAELQRLEQQAGRERPYRNAPRTLDLDLLLYGSARIAGPVLTVPHPRMTERAFVMLPLSEVAPGRVSASQVAAVQGQGIWRL